MRDMNIDRAIIISFLLHVALFWLSSEPLSLFETEEDFELEWVQIEEPQRPSILPGKKTRRVKKQTVKRDTPSPFRGNMGIESTTTPGPPKKNNSTAAAPEPSSTLDLTPASPLDGLRVVSKKTKKNSSLLDRPVISSVSPPAALQSFLPPDIELGQVTALNTDQDIYYSFYRRMAEKVIWPWGQSVEQGVRKLREQGRLGGAQKWITIVEVTLDPKGHVLNIQPLKLSGFWEIDQAPTLAFEQAKQFPNPPEGMLEEDGYIRIKYQFAVYYRPRRNR